MILVFGGTTEGRKAIKELEEAGQVFFYSTKTGGQDVTLHHGVAIDGAMNSADMLSFCRDRHIRLLVDAAHPFAEQLHQTVASVAAQLHIPAIRFERLFPERDKGSCSWLRRVFRRLESSFRSSRRAFACVIVSCHVRVRLLWH